MIGFLRGVVSHLFPDYCFIDVQGAGYRVFIPNSTRQQLALNSTAVLYTYLSVREDALLLYGFYTQDEYELFLHLISINGIGPKVALGVLSAVSPADFRLAVSQQNATLLTRIPGIGKKTAERMILELKDKIGLSEGINAAAYSNSANQTGPVDEAGEAVQALMALGYNQAEILPLVNKVKAPGLSVPEIIKLVLKEIARR